jgi:hypothetical protein
MQGLIIVVGAAVVLPLLLRVLFEVGRHIEQDAERSKHITSHPVHISKV